MSSLPSNIVSPVPTSSSPLSSPPSPSSDEYSDQRNDSYTSQHSLYQDQDSGYDGFCPEKSIYSTGSSDTSSVMSGSEAGQEAPSVSVSHGRDLEIYARTRPRPRPAPIYEKHGDYGVGCGQYGTLAPRGRATIAQATVVNLVKTPPPPPEEPPPLPPSLALAVGASGEDVGQVDKSKLTLALPGGAGMEAPKIEVSCMVSPSSPQAPRCK